MSNEQGMQVTIYSNHVRVPNGLGAFKNVSLTDFYKEIQRVAAGEEQNTQPMQGFRLPNETVSVSFNAHQLDILMYFPEEKRLVRHGSSKFTIPFPNTVIRLSLKSNGKGGWVMDNVKWLCTDYKIDEVPNIANWEFTPQNMRNHLWVLPLPNQYGNGGMCVGANSYRTLYTNDLRGLNELYHHILVASPFNDDLWGRGSGLNWGGNAKSWFSALSKLTEFPYDRLGGYPQPAAAVAMAEPEEDEEEDEED